MMEKVVAKLIDGQVEYKRVGDKVERLRVVKDEIILDGSTNSLTAQIEAAQRRVAELEVEIANPCDCERCALAKSEAEAMVGDERKNLSDLLALLESLPEK